jgi:hypothetical protein
LTNKSNSTSSGVTSSASTAQLSESASARDQVGSHAQLGGGVGRAREGDDVAAVDAIEQVARRTHHQLQRAFGQQARFDDQPHHRLGQVAGGRGRLDDGRHAGKKGRRELLERAPDGEVERVDVHGHAAPRHQHVRAGELACLAERHRRAFVDQVAGRQLVAAHAGIREQRAGAALDVDPAVGARGAGVRGDRIERLLALHQELGQRLQPRGALLEVERQQRGHADAPRVIDGFAEVDLVGVRERHGAAVDRARERRARARAHEAAADVALQLLSLAHDDVLSCEILMWERRAGARSARKPLTAAPSRCRSRS